MALQSPLPHRNDLQSRPHVRRSPYDGFPAFGKTSGKGCEDPDPGAGFILEEIQPRR